MGQLTPEMRDWLLEVLKIDPQEPEAQDFVTKSKSSKYEGEHETTRTTPQGEVKNRDIITARYSEKEKTASSLHVNEEGKILQADGSPLDHGEDEAEGYVLDPETGKLVTFPGDSIYERAKNPDGTPGELIEEHKITSRMGRIDALKEIRGRGNIAAKAHHTTPLGGADVAGAGMLSAEQGELSSITNQSGHYLPEFVQLQQTIEHLTALGATLDKTIVDAEGDDADPKAVALYKALQPKLKKLPKMRAVAQKLVKVISQGQGEPKQLADAKLRAAVLKDEIGKIEKAMALLAQLGVGPRQSTREDIDVGYSYVEGGGEIDGAEFVGLIRSDKVKKIETDVDTFMRYAGHLEDAPERRGRPEADELDDGQSDIEDSEEAEDSEEEGDNAAAISHYFTSLDGGEDSVDAAGSNYMYAQTDNLFDSGDSMVGATPYATTVESEEEMRAHQEELERILAEQVLIEPEEIADYAKEQAEEFAKAVEDFRKGLVADESLSEEKKTALLRARVGELRKENLNQARKKVNPGGAKAAMLDELEEDQDKNRRELDRVAKKRAKELEDDGKIVRPEEPSGEDLDQAFADLKDLDLGPEDDEKRSSSPDIVPPTAPPPPVDDNGEWVFDPEQYAPDSHADPADNSNNSGWVWCPRGGGE